MHVSHRVAALFLTTTFLLSVLVSGLFSSHYNSDHHLQLTFSTVGMLILIVVSGKLLHTRQQLEAAKQNLDEAQQLAGVGSWEWDITTGRTYWSDNCYDLFSLSRSTAPPSPEQFLNLIHPEDRSAVRKATLSAAHFGHCFEVRYRLHNDPEHKIFLSRGKIVPNMAGNTTLLVGSIQDITVKVQRELLREELVRQKDLFITRLGHDLKTPLTPLVTLLPLIKSRSTDPRQNELLDLCINSVSHINELVSKTLRLARLTSDATEQMPRSSINLGDIANRAIHHTVTSMKTTPDRFNNTLPVNLTTLGYQNEIEELFEQILSNAVKFSPAETPITLSAVTHDDSIKIEINDCGIGLTPEEQEHIFDDFYKADSSRHSLGSSGLGLTICRRIVEHHDGTITAQSPGRNKGTTIRITLKTGGTL